VTLGQSLHIVSSNACNCEVLRSSHALQGAEALEGYLTRSCYKLEEGGKLFLFKGRKYLKEPDTLLWVFRVPIVVSVLTEVLQVEVGQTWNEQFKLLVTENGDNVFRNKLVEALKESIHLLFHLDVHFEESDLLKVIEFVIIWYCFVLTVRYEVNLSIPPEEVLRRNIVQIEHFHVVF